MLLSGAGNHAAIIHFGALCFVFGSSYSKLSRDASGTRLIEISGWYFKGNDLGCADDANINESACWMNCLNTLNCRLVAYALTDTPTKCCFKGYGSYEVVQSSDWKLLTDRPFRSFQHQPNSHPGKRGPSCETGIPCDDWNLVEGRANADICKTLCLLYPDCNVAIIHNKDGRCYLDRVENWMESGYGPFDSWVL
ncbi:uncharacterized protein LOC129585706 [Paramacrobiotus metropolitanus]|uniref:uncharacterized protein LOC129585706 n=1 Tax=Paramacrobiotus metropolitanus TaxID=2943436 RepID=UPI002445FB86|nr:uncharacterized protein LOC129585706 [Paramacrobiotus metropolitanus]